LHLSDASPAAQQAARWVHEAGGEVGFDGTHFHPSLWQVLPLVDYLIVSRFFASEFAAHVAGRGLGRAAADFASLLPAAGSLALSAPPAVGERGRDVAPPAIPTEAGDDLLPAPAGEGWGGGKPSPAREGWSGGASQHPQTLHPHPAEEAPMLAGEQLLGVARRLRETGPRVVVVTEGEHGSWCASDEGELHVPAFPTVAVDTTGAGDVFHGAFLFGRAQGWDLRRSLLAASATAALKCRALGGRAGIPTLEEVSQLVDTADTAR
jgi:sugar/nucleoside kinase (ribokinase family)